MNNLEFMQWKKTDGQLRLEHLLEVETGYEWAAPGAAFGPQLLVDGQPLTEGWTAEPVRSESREGGALYGLRLVHDNGLTLSYEAKIYADCAATELKCTLENRGVAPVRVTSLSPVHFSLAGGSQLLAHTIRRDVYEMQTTALEQTVTARGGRWNAPENAGWLILENQPQNQCLFLGIQWEREWVLTAAPQADGTVTLEMGLEHFFKDLEPGASMESPAVFLGTAHGGLDEATNAMRRYMTAHLLPAPREDFPWVAYDIWSTEGEHVEEVIRKEADFASDLGVEIFYLDASWWADSSVGSDGAWGRRLGSYVPDRRKFPHGLRGLSDYVHSKGMRFGIWVDPMIVDEFLVATGAVPEKWLVKHEGKPAVLDLTSVDGWPRVNQICTACPEVQEYILEKLSYMIEAYGLDWLKWDDSAFSQPVVCSREDHGHQAGDGNYLAAAGKYRIFRELHERFPELVIEACGYPARIDYGLAPYIRTSWLSDASSPASRVVNNMEFASYVYPNSYNSAWLIEGDEVLQQTDPAALDTVVRSRMMGLFGFGTINGKLSERISLWPKEVHDAVRRNLPYYKQFRHLLSQDVYHYNHDPRLTDAGWRAMACGSYDHRENVTFVFRNLSKQTSLQIRLKGLLPEQDYTVTSLNTGRSVTTSGSALMKTGVTVELTAHPDSSELLLVQAL